jgi:hypothetical protein
MESANLDLEENKEIASKFERALGMGATLATKRSSAERLAPGVDPNRLMLTLITFMKKEDLTKLNSFLNFSVFMISKIITI